MSAAKGQEVVHAVSVDVEDWYQTTIDTQAEVTARFEVSTRKVLKAFADNKVKGTFFVLGLAARRAPHVTRAIHDEGHEVASHGYGHVNLYQQSAGDFREDVIRAKCMLEDQIGTEVIGYRAPSFSVDERSPWAFDVLAQAGYTYDSSVFPIKTSRYGISGYPLEPRIVQTPEGRQIVEAPIACFHFLGRRVPVGGGGYFRLWPYWFIRRAFQQMNSSGRSGVIYFHPYEYDPDEMQCYKGMVSWKRRLHQGLGRRKFAGKVDRLMKTLRLAPLRVVLGDLLARLPSKTAKMVPLEQHIGDKELRT